MYKRQDAGWQAPDGRVYRYRYTLAGVLPNAAYASIVDFRTDEEGLSCQDAMMTLFSSQYPAPHDVYILGM